MILWDLNRFVLVHRLPVHPAPVTAIAVSHLTGDVVTAAGTTLYVWSVRGYPIMVASFTITFASVRIGRSEAYELIVVPSSTGERRSRRRNQRQ